MRLTEAACANGEVHCAEVRVIVQNPGQHKKDHPLVRLVVLTPHHHVLHCR